jgi:hypothetical protein
VVFCAGEARTKHHTPLLFEKIGVKLMSEKIDLLKSSKQLYAPSAKQPALVEVPEMTFLTLEGQGAPDSPLYQEVVSALYQMSYALKFAVKKQDGIDYGVMPLEGLWWGSTEKSFWQHDRDAWLWKMMIAQPVNWVTPQRVEAARLQVIKKGTPLAEQLKMESFNEGLAAQIMHVGPYSSESATVDRLHAFVEEQGYQLVGKHHEIYLGDPRRTAPEKLKTILRHPVQKA